MNLKIKKSKLKQNSFQKIKTLSKNNKNRKKMFQNNKFKKSRLKII